MRPTRAHIAVFGTALAAAALVAAIQVARAPRSDGPRLVRIAAAADLRYALDEAVGRLHDARPDLDVRASYGSSGTFFAQIVNGAPFDLFMSADVDYPRQLASRGLAMAGSEFTYAIGRLVVWVPASSPLDVEKGGMQVLTDARVAHVSIANPAHAPYGRAAEAAMRQSNVYDGVKNKLVFGENVAQALQFVQSGAADVAVVALSLATAPAANDSGRFWIVPTEMYPRMEQGGVILRAAADVDGAREVRAFLLGEAGRAILKRYGFYLPGA